MQFLFSILASPVFSAIGELLGPIFGAIFSEMFKLPENTITVEDGTNALPSFHSAEYLDARADTLLGLPLPADRD